MENVSETSGKIRSYITYRVETESL